ncbi:collagen alpha-1(XXV) chain [Lathamus discolor]|uniref:collagen alpha-1(XXV) chain n=1 Tax=Lathamus discolor TaxID=678569 RepID=UPI0032B70BCB
MGGGGKEIRAAAAEGCKGALVKSRGAAGRDGSGQRGGGGDCCPRWAGPCGSALAALLSALAAASCVYLGVRTSDLQARVAAIEDARGGFSTAAPLPPLPGFSLEQLNAMMQEKVERLLAQKSYEHLAKIRVAREAPPECNCPPDIKFSAKRS